MIDVSDIEKRVDHAITATLPVKDSLGGVNPTNFGQVMEFAKLMAISGAAVPKYLRTNPGGCLAICSRAMRWGMDPFYVAEKSYIVWSKSGEDKIAFESQLLHAVIEKLAPIKGRLRYEIVGEGDERRCKVWATFKGEKEPHSFTGEKLGKRVKDIGYKQKDGRQVFMGSPLWLDKPEVQLFYDASRDWARLYCSDVLAGAYTRDEVALEEPVDITPKPMDGLVQRLRDAKMARAGEGRGFDVERVGSIISGEAQEATDEDPKGRPDQTGGERQPDVGAGDQRRGAKPSGRGDAGGRDKASGQKPTGKHPARPKEEQIEAFPPDSVGNRRPWPKASPKGKR